MNFSMEFTHLLTHTLQHGASAVPSLCLTEHTRAYFEDGILPPEGTICPLDIPLFPNPTSGVFEGFSPKEKQKLESLQNLRIVLEGARRGVDV